MSRFVRASKVRHVFAEPAKDEFCYKDLRLSTATGDHNYIKGNTKFFAIPHRAGGGGSLMVLPYSQVGKVPSSQATITGHSSAVLDFDFNPFHENIIASGSDDTHIKVWGIPDGGLTENLNEPLVDLLGHQRKVSHLQFHPTAANILASVSSDFSIKVWDIEQGSERACIDGFSNLVQDLVWNHDGSLMAASCKDKALRVYDPRTGTAPASEVAAAHDGSKTFKLTFLGTKQNLVSVGFTRQSKRQFKIWDPRNLGTAVATQDIDQAAGVIMPFYDNDTNILFLAGKGDGNIRFYEMVDEAPWQFGISEFRSSTSSKGIAVMPKRTCDTHKHEVVKMLKLTTNSVIPLTFVIPRKSEVFQDDIYPDCYAGVASMTAEEWWGGANNAPVTKSMNPANAGGETKQDSFVPMKSAMQLTRELEAANARIAELEAELATLRG